MRNPMGISSWSKADSSYYHSGHFKIGQNDLNLALRLCRAGPDHRKFLRQIIVSADILAPLYWWKEYDTYKVGTVANSTSTMHKIHSQPFSLCDFSLDMMDAETQEQFQHIVWVLEENRKAFVATRDSQYWWNIIQLLPSSYNQLRTCTMSFENLVNMYRARRTHKLKEWRSFCSWINDLEYGSLIIESATAKT